MNAETLMELAGRCEKAGVDEQRALLKLAWQTIAGSEPIAPADWPFRCYPGTFNRMLEAEAFESAAIMLVPEGHFWSITMRGQNRGGFDACCLKDGPMLWREASTPALALVSAALKARAQEGK